MRVHIAYRIVRQIIGWMLIALGLVGLLIPVLPQLPFLIAGVLLLAPYIRIFRRASAWLHRRYPNYRGPMRRFREFKRPFRPAGASKAGPTVPP